MTLQDLLRHISGLPPIWDWGLFVVLAVCAFIGLGLTLNWLHGLDERCCGSCGGELIDVWHDDDHHIETICKSCGKTEH
jgi:hypothetical protein